MPMSWFFQRKLRLQQDRSCGNVKQRHADYEQRNVPKVDADLNYPSATIYALSTGRDRERRIMFRSANTRPEPIRRHGTSNSRRPRLRTLRRWKSLRTLMAKLIIVMHNKILQHLPKSFAEKLFFLFLVPNLDASCISSQLRIKWYTD